MSRYWGFIYRLSLALWVGGISIFTFLVTPAIFGSFDRDTASKVVDALFRGYFHYVLALSVTALAAFALSGGMRVLAARLQLALLAAAVALNLYVSFGLYPQIREVKSEVKSFVTEPADSTPRKSFRRLHAISAVINLAVLADGAVLVLLDGRRPD